MVFALGLGACATALPDPVIPVASRVRPSWVAGLSMHREAIAQCLEHREAPRYVAFVDPLPSGAVGVSTVDAFGSVEHCAVFEGRIVRREPAAMSAVDIADAGGALLSVGVRPPLVGTGRVSEEVLEQGATIGWLFWPSEQSGELGPRDPMDSP
jgi:hypothetical protein